MFASKLPVFSSALTNCLLTRCCTTTAYCDGMKPLICEPKYPSTVTIIGATCPVGKMLALLLKQNRHIEVLRLFDTCDGPCGIAADLSHIDTKTKVVAYTGLDVLKDAITKAQIVVTCCGQRTRLIENEEMLFEMNADAVRNVAIYMAEFNPKGILCIATPPVNALVPMVSQEYKRALVYDHRKIIGIANLLSIRANAAVGKAIGTDACKVVCPIVGGLDANTAVPLISQVSPSAQITAAVAHKLRSEIICADEVILDALCGENGEGIIASQAFATARFITSMTRALSGDEGITEFAYVKHTNHIAKFLPYMVSVVKLGTDGIKSTHMPRVNEDEKKALQEAAVNIRKSIVLGESYITGDYPVRCKRCQVHSCPVVITHTPNKKEDIIENILKKVDKN